MLGDTVYSVLKHYAHLLDADTEARAMQWGVDLPSVSCVSNTAAQSAAVRAESHRHLPYAIFSSGDILHTKP